MALNSKPRSDSSASNKRKKYQHDRAHTRARRQVNTGTPRVFETSRNSSSPAGGRSTASRSSSRYAGQGTQTGSRRANEPRNKDTRKSSRKSARPPRSAAKARGAAKRRGGIGLKLGIIALVLALLGGGFTALYLSNLLPITDVQVAGNEKLQSEYIAELADVPADSTFLRTDTETIAANLLSEPWIQSVDIERVFPGTLILHITERPLAAIVDIVPETANDGTSRWLIASDGTWIVQVEGSETADTTATENAETDEGGESSESTDNNESAEISETDESEPNEESSDENNTAASNNEDRVATVGVEISAEELVDLPKIKDVSAAVRPVAGVQETDEGIANALALLRGFSDEMRAMVASISAPDAVKTTLTLYNNVGVAFGAAEDMEAKEQAIASLLAEHEGTITYINVRVADRATYRATEY